MQTFECRLKGNDHGTRIVARTSGKAKSQYLSFIRDPCPDAKYQDIRCRSLGAPQSSDDFKRVARSRGVPFAKVGMRVTVNGRPGAIVGHNESGNFDVLFDGVDFPMNCHPNWMMTYYAEDGSVLAEFTE
jgi:hypothetical protein